MQKEKKSQPIVCGIDIGSWTVKISYYDGEKFDTLTNEANFRQTPSLVAFTPHERMIGEPANIKMKSNFANTIRAPMRLIGLGKNPHMIEQELKYSTVNYDLEDGIKFLVKSNEKNLQLQPEQILMALMSKVKDIVSHHNFHIYASFFAIPSYLSNSERSAVRKCAQLVKLGQVYLIQDWIAVASEYSYFRIKQLQLEHERNVIFIDVGYSKFSIYACQFTPTKCTLLDYQHLKYTGSKNMDNYLTQFYDDYFNNKFKDQRIVTNAKALVKLRDMIEKQRKVLSANSEHHMNIEYIANEQDLSYNIKREQFQTIITPVLSEMATALHNIRSRVGPKFPIHAVQLLGGASRIPLIQQIISQNLQIDPSKTLNSSESMARGAAIYGAAETGFLNIDYQIERLNFAAVSVAWNRVKKQKYLGQNQKDYPNKKVIFDYGCHYPCQQVVNLGPQGVVQLYIYYQHQITSQSIGYLRVTTPNKVVFVFDRDKIVSAKCMVGGFMIYNFHEIKEDKWAKMQKIEKELQQNDKKILTLYHIKNQYESLVYKIKDKASDQWKKYSSQEEQKNIRQTVLQAEKWIQTEKQKPLKSQADLKEYTDRMDNLGVIYQVMASRKKNFQEIEPQYQNFMNKAHSKTNLTSQGKKELKNLIETVQIAFQKMSKSFFQEKILCVADIRQYIRKISRIQ